MDAKEIIIELKAIRRASECRFTKENISDLIEKINKRPLEVGDKVEVLFGLRDQDSVLKWHKGTIDSIGKCLNTVHIGDYIVAASEKDIRRY